MADRVLVFRDLSAKVELDGAWPGTPVSGDPHTKTWNLHTSDDGKVLSGIWESTPGVWRIDGRVGILPAARRQLHHRIAGQAPGAFEGRGHIHRRDRRQGHVDRA